MNYISLAREEAVNQGVDPDLITALIEQESGGNIEAVSNKGAVGLMQVMPSTGEEVAKKIGLTDFDPNNPEHNIKVGVAYLKEQLDTFGDRDLALAAYNAGPTAVRKYGGIPPYKETQEYVKRISSKLPIQSDSKLETYAPIQYDKEQTPLPLMGYSAEQKAALYTAMISGNPFDLYEGISSELQSGNYNSLDLAYQKVSENKEMATQEIVQKVLNDPFIHPQDKIEFMHDAYKSIEALYNKSYVDKAEAVKQSVLDSIAVDTPIYDSEDEETKRDKLYNFFAADNTTSRIRALAKDAVERVEGSTSIPQDVIGFAGAVLQPLPELRLYRAIVQDVIPEQDKGFWSSAKASDYLKTLKTYVLSAQGEERVYRASKIIDSLEKNSSLISDTPNQWLFTQGVNEILGEAMGGNGKGIFGIDDETLLDVFHWFEVGVNVIGATGKVVDKIVTAKNYPEVLDEIGEASRKLSSEVATAAVDDVGIQRATSISPEAVAASQVPSIARGDKLSKIYTSLTPEHKEILRLSGEAKWNLLPVEEQNIVIESLKARAEDYAKAGNLHLLPGTSAISHGDGEIVVNATYAKNMEHGWKNPGAALAVGKSKFPEYNVKAEKIGNEYFLKVDIPYNYDANLTKNISNLILDGNAVKTNGEISIPFRPLAMVRPPEAIFTKESLARMIRGADYKYAITQKVADSMNPLLKLPSSKQHTIIATIEKLQDKTGIERQAILDSLPKDIRKGIDIYRSASDMQFLADNVIRHSQLSSDGFMHVINFKNKEEFFARPIKDNRSLLGEIAYNPTAKSKIVVTKDMQIARLEKPVVKKIASADGSVKEVKFEYVFIDDKNTKLRALPQQVLPYIEGYITRYYNSNVFVTDGEGRAVAGFKNLADANQWIKENPGEWDIRLSRELLSKGKLSQAYDDITASYGGPVFGKRGAVLKGNASEDIKDPITALYNTIQAFASRQTIRNLTTDLKQRFVNTYKEWLPRDKINNPIFPESFEQINFKGIDPKNKRIKEQAEQWFKQIKMLEGAERSMIDKEFSKMMADIATSPSLANNRFMQDVFLGLANSSPTTAVRSFAFYFWLASNPGRQLLMQGLQPLFIIGIKPKAVAEGYPAAMALLSKDKRAIRLMYGKLADDVAYAFEESGFRGSVSGHQWVEVMERLSVDKNVFQQAWDTIIRKPAETLRYMGFDAGEKLNLGVSWHVALQRYLEKNPKASLRDRKVIDAIAADARQLALNMGSRAGNAPYNHGLFGALLQFESAQHKATLAMLPERWGGSRAFTPAEKLRLAAGNFLVYGLDGVGLLKQYEQIRDRIGLNVDRETDRWLKGGMLEFAFNGIATAITGEDQDVDFSSGMAMLSEGKLINFTAAAISAVINPSSREKFLNNLGQMGIILNDVPAYGALHQAIAAGEALFGNCPLDTPERIQRAIEEFNPIFGQYSNYLQARAAWNLGVQISRYGTIGGDMTKVEAFMLGLAGVRTQEEADVRRYKEEVSGKYVPRPEKPSFKEEDVREDSWKLYQEIKKDVLLYGGWSAWDSKANMYKAIDTKMNKMRAYFEHNGEKDYYWAQVEEEVIKLINNELIAFMENPKEYRNNELVENLNTKVVSGEAGLDKIRKLEYAISNATPEQKAFLEEYKMYYQNFVENK